MYTEYFTFTSLVPHLNDSMMAKTFKIVLK